MNFLAHLHLGPHSHPGFVGAVLGDFVRGQPSTLALRFPTPVLDAIMLHRRIDAKCGQILRTAELAKHFPRPLRRIAPIALDVFFDHCLANSWTKLTRIPLDDFIDTVHDSLRRHWPLWCDRADQMWIASRLIENNWLKTNTTIDGVYLTLKRVSTRREFLHPLPNCVDYWPEIQHHVENAFNRAYPELVAEAANFMAELRASRSINVG